MATLHTFLMFDGKAEEAMQLYVSLFPGARVSSLKKYGPGEAGAEGSVMHASFVLGDQRFMCIDSPAKHAFTFTPSTSIYVECASEAELDRLYERLSAGGQIMMPRGAYPFAKKFAWLADRFGVSWQLSLAL